jgi:hypothetical protein
LTWLSWWNIMKYPWQVNRSLLTSNSLQLSPACLKQVTKRMMAHGIWVIRLRIPQMMVAGMVYGLRFTRSATINPFVKETEPNVMRQDPGILKLLIQSRCAKQVSALSLSFRFLCFPKILELCVGEFPCLNRLNLPVSIASTIWEDSDKHLAVEVYRVVSEWGTPQN